MQFKAFHDVLRAQGDTIRSLEAQLEDKASHAQVTRIAEALGAPGTLRATLAELGGALADKADAAELHSALAQRVTRADLEAAIEERPRLAEVQHALDMKATTEDVDALAARVAQLGAELEAKADARETERALSTKAEASALRGAIADATSAADMAVRMEAMVPREHLAGAMAEKVDRADLETTVSSLRDEILQLEHTKLRAGREETAALRAEVKRQGAEISALRDEQRRMAERARADTDTAASALRAFNAINAKFDGALVDMRRQLATVEEAAASGGGRAGAEALMDALDEKVDREEMRHWLELKSDVAQVNEALAQKANISAVNEALERAESSRAASGATANSQLADKANLSDVCALLDAKAGIDDVNRVLSEVNSELEARATVDDLRRTVQDQAAINASLASEAAVARWIWKTGKTKAGNAVPWNVQSVNTDPSNFLWERDKATVVAVAPGLYEVTFGFFTRRKPSVRLLVNGEPVLAAVNSASYVVHHSSGRLTNGASDRLRAHECAWACTLGIAQRYKRLSVMLTLHLPV